MLTIHINDNCLLKWQIGKLHRHFNSTLKICRNLRNLKFLVAKAEAVMLHFRAQRKADRHLEVTLFYKAQKSFRENEKQRKHFVKH